MQFQKIDFHLLFLIFSSHGMKWEWQELSWIRLLVLCYFDGVRQDFFGVVSGVFHLPMWSPPGVLTLILLHVSPISTNGAAIVPQLCASLPLAQSPWVSKLNSVMFGLLPTHTGIHGYRRPLFTHLHTHTHTHTLLLPSTQMGSDEIWDCT